MFADTAINGQEEAFQEKKAALDLARKALAQAKRIDTKFNKLVSSFKEIFEYKAVYKEILRDMLGFKEKAEETTIVKEINNIDNSNKTEVEVIDNIEVKRNEYWVQVDNESKSYHSIPKNKFVFGDIVKLKEYPNNNFFVVGYHLDKQHDILLVDSKGEHLKSHSLVSESISCEPGVDLIKSSTENTIKSTIKSVKLLILNSRDNSKLKILRNLISNELYEKALNECTLPEKNHIECIKACPKLPEKYDGDQLVKLGTMVLYIDPKTNKESTAYYIGYYLNGKRLTCPEKRAILIADGPRMNQPIECDIKCLKHTDRQPDSNNSYYKHMLTELELWLGYYYTNINDVSRLSVNHSKSNDSTQKQHTIPYQIVLEKEDDLF